MTRLIGETVTSLRKSRGMSQSVLAERMTSHGQDWSQSTVAKLENNRRESVTAQELLALALVLGVPPVMLMADPRRDEQVPVAEDMAVAPWPALLWMTGYANPPGPPEPTYTAASELIQCGHEVVEIFDALGRVERPWPDEEEAQRRNDRRHAGLLGRLQTVLARIKELGAESPNLPEYVLKRAAELDVELPGQG